MVEVIKSPTEDDWWLAKLAALTTIGKENVVKLPDDEWKYRILRARHSPIRVLMFMVRMNPVPTWVSTHFARHKHLEPYIQSQRNDRQDNYDRTKAYQDAPVIEMLWMNAEELMTVANKRLCGCSSEETREQARELCEAVIETNPEFSPFLIPFCMEYGCHEFSACGNAMRYLPRNRLNPMPYEKRPVINDNVQELLREVSRIADELDAADVGIVRGGELIDGSWIREKARLAGLEL